MGTSSLDVDGSVVNLDPAGVLQALSQLASAPDPPAPAFVRLLSSFHFDPHTTNNQQAKNRRVSDVSGYPCQQCDLTYSRKSNLKRHVNTAHASRRRLVVTEVFECEDCEEKFATQAALDAHQANHPSSSTDSKSQKYNCVFCGSERTNIYFHYGYFHKIEYPEQIMIENGNVLVLSDINTGKGKAPWFLREKEKMKSYNNVTCRLCETETSFENPEILADHYVMYHQVDPAMLDNTTHLFRAEKGAHLMDLPTSQAPKRKLPDSSTVRAKVPCRLEEKNKIPNNKTDLKVNLEKLELNAFICNECTKGFASEALLDSHKTVDHRPKKEEDKSEKYTCALCFKSVVQIYKHYGNVHNIEYPEQMLFQSGKVLVRTTINTNDGQARWFVSEREKAERKYTPNTCRLCEIVYENATLLEKHYISQHKVEPVALERLDNLRCLFRAEKGAHLVDLPASRTAKRPRRASAQTPVKTNSERSSSVDTEQDGAGLIMYQCADCDVAATTCDASIEHAQLHQLPAYKPIPQTCDTCNFAFEVQCFSDHALHHLSRNEYRIVKFHSSKLLHAWSDMFQGLSESHVQRIKASSTYQYTRRVKMNADNAPGIPMYQCGKCEMYVRAKDVEGHCYSKTACVEHEDHCCSDCDVYFYTSVGLTEHEKYHRQYGTGCFRKVTFNCREDELINRALQKLQNAKEEGATETQKTAPPINIIGDVVVPLKFCGVCKKFISNTEYEKHAATHNVTNVVEQSAQGPQEQNCVNSNSKSNNAENARNKVNEIESNIEGTVESWNSDNDSCRSLRVFSYAVQVDVHAPNSGDVQNDDTVNANENDTQNSADLQENVALVEEFSPEITDDQKRDMRSLGFVALGTDKKQWAYIPDDLATDNLLEAIDAAIGYSSFSSNDSDSKLNISTSFDNSTTATVTKDVVGPCNDTRDENDANTTVIEAVAQNEQELDSRPSSRYILTRMIQDEWDDVLEERD